MRSAPRVMLLAALAALLMLLHAALPAQHQDAAWAASPGPLPAPAPAEPGSDAPGEHTDSGVRQTERRAVSARRTRAPSLPHTKAPARRQATPPPPSPCHSPGLPRSVVLRC
ncbi:hypothetical protein AB0M28_18240 [Streptomyces sp. NPDC051940]|uniref:hypothetical protein n=1 Tax=Streptomyces sp. NPDC051940 TaxID=3155675 RepID=UPI0034410101